MLDLRRFSILFLLMAAAGPVVAQGKTNPDGTTTRNHELDPPEAAAVPAPATKPDENGVTRGDGSHPVVAVDNMQENGQAAFGTVETIFLVAVGGALLGFLGVFILTRLNKTRAYDPGNLVANDPWVRQRLKELNGEG